MRVYLCGAMTYYYNKGEYDKAKTWRKALSKTLDRTLFKVFDPTENSDKHYTYPKEYQKGFVFQNYTYLINSQVLIVNLEHIEHSIGSLWEMVVAWENKIPIIAFGECEKWEYSPHLNEMISVKLKKENDETWNWVITNYLSSVYHHRIN